MTVQSYLSLLAKQIGMDRLILKKAIKEVNSSNPSGVTSFNGETGDIVANGDNLDISINNDTSINEICTNLQAQIDNNVSEIVDINTNLDTKANVTDVYDKPTIDSKLILKADTTVTDDLQEQIDNQINALCNIRNSTTTPILVPTTQSLVGFNNNGAINGSFYSYDSSTSTITLKEKGTYNIQISANLELPSTTTSGVLSVFFKFNSSILNRLFFKIYDNNTLETINYTIQGSVVRGISSNTQLTVLWSTTCTDLYVNNYQSEFSYQINITRLTG